MVTKFQACVRRDMTCTQLEMDYLLFFFFKGFNRASLTGLRTSGKVIQRGNTMGRTMRNVTCLRALDGQDRLRGWSSSSSAVSAGCCRTRRQLKTGRGLGRDGGHIRQECRASEGRPRPPQLLSQVFFF